MMVHACHSNYYGKYIRRIVVQTGLGKKQDPIFTIITAKRGCGIAPVVICLPSKCEALSSNSSVAKNKKRKVKNR
jgi:hypothetical protein